MYSSKKAHPASRLLLFRFFQRLRLILFCRNRSVSDLGFFVFCFAFEIFGLFGLFSVCRFVFGFFGLASACRFVGPIKNKTYLMQHMQYHCFHDCGIAAHANVYYTQLATWLDLLKTKNMCDTKYAAPVIPADCRVTSTFLAIVNRSPTIQR